MSNFMFLFRGGETPTSPERMQAQMQKWMNWIQRLRNDGKYVAGDPLQGTGKVLRSPNKVITDGPLPKVKNLSGDTFSSVLKRSTKRPTWQGTVLSSRAAAAWKCVRFKSS